MSESVERARKAVAGFRMEAPENNLPFCAEPLEHPEFIDGNYDTEPVSRTRA
ncbi:acetyl-CoA carboxylase, biotin carboxylase subunit [Streptosporangium subroseum]|uniref:Acetyl-CoA carboxylase, biotin carboxylase subunit n=1 Tax=Streptosporangium subroseum TaxID=106412 RepID=A0A239P9F7_9ACTN|nr:hypothetical protein [Streptosporangium subroseum]SNT63585.1 acetyl-CoA carboxylase, biotin carboxylase subunit [Streptosporangium subroseum]